MPHSRIIRISNGHAKTGEYPFDLVVGIRRDLTDKDLWMVRLIEILPGDLELFEKFLAFSNAGENDVYVLIRRQTREPDHVFGKVEYLHGLTHIEDEYLAAGSESAGLQHELRRLRNS